MAQPTYAQALSRVYRSLRGAVSLDELIERVVTERGKQASGAKRAVLRALEHSHELILAGERVYPVWAWLDGIRFRIDLSDWNEGRRAYLPLAAFAPFDYAMPPGPGGEPPEITIVAPDGEACTLILTRAEDDQAEEDPDEPPTPWVLVEAEHFGVARFASGTFVAALKPRDVRLELSWEPDHPERAKRRARRDRQLADALCDALAGQPGPVDAAQLLLRLYPRFVWSRESPGRPWLDVVQHDARLSLLKTDGAYAIAAATPPSRPASGARLRTALQGSANAARPDSMPRAAEYSTSRPLTDAELREHLAQNETLKRYWGASIEAEIARQLQRVSAAGAVCILHAGPLLQRYMMRLMAAQTHQELLARRGQTVWSLATYLATHAGSPRCLEEADAQNLIDFVCARGTPDAPYPGDIADVCDDIRHFYKHLERSGAIRSARFAEVLADLKDHLG